MRLAIRNGKLIRLRLNIRAAIFTLNDCCFNLRRAVKNDRCSLVVGVDGQDVWTDCRAIIAECQWLSAETHNDLAVRNNCWNYICELTYTLLTRVRCSVGPIIGTSQKHMSHPKIGWSRHNEIARPIFEICSIWNWNCCEPLVIIFVFFTFVFS